MPAKTTSLRHGPPCWLLELEKYAKPGSETPRENFVTTALAWALDSCPRARVILLSMLFPDEKDTTNFSASTVRTQGRNSDGKIPDILVFGESSEFVGAVECKVMSPHGTEAVVSGYGSALPQTYGCKRQCAVYVAAEIPSPPWKNVRCYTWRDLVTALLAIEPSDEGYVIVKAFIEYMRTIGLGDAAPVSPELAALDKLIGDIDQTADRNDRFLINGHIVHLGVRTERKLKGKPATYPVRLSCSTPGVKHVMFNLKGRKPKDWTTINKKLRQFFTAIGVQLDQVPQLGAAKTVSAG